MYPSVLDLFNKYNYFYLGMDFYSFTFLNSMCIFFLSLFHIGLQDFAFFPCVKKLSILICICAFIKILEPINIFLHISHDFCVEN